MLDLRSKSVLKILVEECNDNSFKIIDIKDIIINMPVKYQISSEVISKILKLLEKGEYITIKYIDDEQICLSPTPFGRQFIESDEMQSKNKKTIKILSIKNNILVFIFALLGAFLGTLIFNLLF